MADFRDFDEYQISVPGGELAVVRWPPAAAGSGADAGADADAGDVATAVMIHGITGNALAWAGIVEAVDARVNLLAFDMRGRANSRDIAPPPAWGIEADAQDVIAVLDDAGLDSAVLVGQSLGAFVACTVAARYPERVQSIVAIDGGVRYALPTDLDTDQVLELTLGPAIRKLRMTFADGEAYLDYHRAHPSFAGNWSPQLTAYLGRDTFRQPDGTVISSCVEAAIRADGEQLVVDDFVNYAINQATCPVTLLCAERGILNQPQGFYNDAILDAAGVDRARVRVEFVAGTNHYTLNGPGVGADSVAEAIVRAVEAGKGGDVRLRQLRS